MNSNLSRVVNLLKVINEIRLTGGVSYNINTGELNPRFGYMVAIEGHSEIVSPVLMDEETVRRYVLDHANQLAEENAYLGCWFDGTNFVLDVSNHFESKRDAYYWAIVRKQKAIWDCANRDEIIIKQKHETVINRPSQTA